MAGREEGDVPPKTARSPHQIIEEYKNTHKEAIKKKAREAESPATRKRKVLSPFPLNLGAKPEPVPSPVLAGAHAPEPTPRREHHGRDHRGEEEYARASQNGYNLSLRTSKRSQIWPK